MDSQIKEDKGRDQLQVSVLLRCLSYRDRRVGNPLSMAHMHCIISVFHNFFATLKRKKKKQTEHKEERNPCYRLRGGPLHLMAIKIHEVQQGTVLSQCISFR